MLIPFGVFSAAGAGGGAAAGAYELISTTILGAAAASVTLSSLDTYSATYKHLQIRYVVRSDRTQDTDMMRIQLNGDTGANYASHRLTGDGTSVISAAQSNSTIITNFTAMIGGSLTAGIFGPGVIDFTDAYGTKTKTLRMFDGLPTTNANSINLSSALWNSTSALTSISFAPNYGTNLVAGSRFSLYGVKG